jgi:hypothetical protein
LFIKEVVGLGRRILATKAGRKRSTKVQDYKTRHLIQKLNELNSVALTIITMPVKNCDPKMSQFFYFDEQPSR